jgi:predicted HAD superfamily Cof-like phosphohydrolase
MHLAEVDMVDFMTAGEQYVGTAEGPHIPSDEVRDLRWRLIDEEVNKELLPAMMEGDLVAIADGCIDAIYVILGTLVSYGIPASECWDEVQRSNMDKYRDGLIKDAGGKVQKPADWTPPDIAGILKEYGWDG